MNFIQIVGRIIQMPVPIESNTKAKYSEMIVSVESNFREFNGEFREDLFPVRLWRGVSEATTDSCREGRLLCVKGRVEIEDSRYVIVAENVEILFA